MSSESEDRALKDFALRNGVEVTLTTGRIFNADGNRRSRVRAPATPPMADVAPPVVQKEVADEKIEALRQQIQTHVTALAELRKELTDAKAQGALGPFPSSAKPPPEKKVAGGYVLEVRERDADGFLRFAVLRPASGADFNVDDTLEGRALSLVKSRGL